MNTINDLADYFHRTNTPGFFHQTGPHSYDVFVMKDDQERVTEDLRNVPITILVTVWGVTSKSEMRRLHIQKQELLAPVSDEGISKVGLDNHGLPVRELNQILGVDKWMHREDKKDWKVVSTSSKSPCEQLSKKITET